MDNPSALHTSQNSEGIKAHMLLTQEVFYGCYSNKAGPFSVLHHSSSCFSHRLKINNGL